MLSQFFFRDSRSYFKTWFQVGLVPSLLRFLKQLRLVQTARHITTQPPQKNFRLNSSCRSLAISISVWYSASSRKLVSSGSLTKYG